MFSFCSAFHPHSLHSQVFLLYRYFKGQMKSLFSIDDNNLIKFKKSCRVYKTFTFMASAIVLFSFKICCSLYYCTTASMEVWIVNINIIIIMIIICVFKKNSRGSLPIFHVSFPFGLKEYFNSYTHKTTTTTNIK